MNISSLTIVLTDQCNFKCQYCFQQQEISQAINFENVKKSIDFFYPYLTEGCFINFYGGEPLVAYDSLKHIVEYTNDRTKQGGKSLTYTFTTNGSLITSEMINFFARYPFQIMISFDGLVQEINRQTGSYNLVLANIKKLQSHADIHLELNSVFAPNTVRLMSKSIIHNINLGVPHIRFSVDRTRPWSQPDLNTYQRELDSLRIFLQGYYKSTKRIPVTTFRPKSNQGPFWCAAGTNQLALAPDGLLWGCFLFYDYFNARKESSEFSKYCLGHIDEFLASHEKIYPEILANYHDLKQQGFWTTQKFCSMCEELDECRVCPMDAAFSGSIIGKVPDWTCQLNQILLNQKRIFAKQIKDLYHTEPKSQ